MTHKSYSFNLFRKDFLAGLIVLLIALPLCLGIAQASHAPLFSGIVAGIVGGIVVGTFSGSHLSVTGPTAGLTAIVLVAIIGLGDFNTFLCAVVIAGGNQLALGFAKAGGIANYIPSSVIEGMLAGIGMTIIIKQIPDAVGFVNNAAPFIDDADDGFVANTIDLALHHIQEGALVISLTGLLVLIMWATKLFKKVQLIPEGLVVVVLGTLINLLFVNKFPVLGLDPMHLVKLPVAGSASEFFGQFSFPNLRGFSNPVVWQTGIVIAIVASIETLHCIEATDKLDPMKRYTSTNRELKAQGIGNMLSGFLGGLPVTSVIVRSSANVNSGAQSKASAIVHGVLLLVCAAAIPSLLNMIPKASLAAILLYTGYKLCKPSSFVHMWKSGITQFIPFATTALCVVGIDLLKGVGIGLLISIIYILRQNARISFSLHTETADDAESTKMVLAEEVSFLNKSSIKKTLHQLPENTRLIVDACKSQYIDFDVLEVIHDFAENAAYEKDISVSLIGFKDVYAMSLKH